MLLASLCSKNLLKMQKVSFFQEFSFQVSSKNAKSQERPRLIFKKELAFQEFFFKLPPIQTKRLSVTYNLSNIILEYKKIILTSRNVILNN